MLRLVFILAIFFSATGVQGQEVIEVNIKPFEWALLNFETGIAVGNEKTRVGVFLSYRPATQVSGEVKALGSGLAGGYGQNHLNRLYNSYTIGLFQKTYFKKQTKFFFETNLFYRNWQFTKKYARLDNVEGYRFNGNRTERVHVYGLKLLIGRTMKLFNKRSGNTFFAIDIVAGLGSRYKTSKYETINGTVYDLFYNYLPEQEDRFIITPQFGVKLLLVRKSKK